MITGIDSPMNPVGVRSTRISALRRRMPGPGEATTPGVSPAPMVRLATAAHLYPLVEKHVGEVDEVVDDQVASPDEEHDGLQDDVVAPFDGHDREPSNTRPREHLLGDDRPTDHRADLQAEHRDDGKHRVLDGVLQDYLRTVEPFRIGRPYVTGPEHVDQTRT